MELLSDVRQKIPQEIDYERTVKVLSDDPNPLNVVLLQEIQRYNALLSTIRSVWIQRMKFHKVKWHAIIIFPSHPSKDTGDF